MLRTQNVPTIIVILMYVIESEEYRINNVIFWIFFDIISLNTNLVAVWPQFDLQFSNLICHTFSISLIVISTITITSDPDWDKSVMTK